MLLLITQDAAAPPFERRKARHADSALLYVIMLLYCHISPCRYAIQREKITLSPLLIISRLLALTLFRSIAFRLIAIHIRCLRHCAIAASRHATDAR